jgi:hypothetical protein
MKTTDLNIVPMDRELSIAELEGVAGGGFWDTLRNDLKSIIYKIEHPFPPTRFPYEPPVPIRVK